MAAVESGKTRSGLTGWPIDSISDRSIGFFFISFVVDVDVDVDVVVVVVFAECRSLRCSFHWPPLSRHQQRHSKRSSNTFRPSTASGRGSSRLNLLQPLRSAALGHFFVRHFFFTLPSWFFFAYRDSILRRTGRVGSLPIVVGPNFGPSHWLRHVFCSKS